MFLVALSVLMVLALLNRRAFPYVCVLALNWAWTAVFQAEGWWDWMPLLDAVTCYGLLACFFIWPWRWGLTAFSISLLPLLCHLAYKWPQPEGVYYGVEYMYALQALSLASMAVLALGDWNVRSFVGAVLEGARSLFNGSSRPRLARHQARESLPQE